MPGTGRYAPTPSSQLHLGNLRTAVLAWLFARASGRRFVLRIEDLDQVRVAAAAGVSEQQVADLAALGVTFDPPVVVQSARLGRYAEAVSALPTYECFCTRREIAEATTAPHPSPTGDGFRPYPGTCRDLSEAERAGRRAVRPAALRVRADGAESAVWDVLHGEVRGIVDDFVLVRGDGAFAYNLAVVVDDLDAGVDQVVRGDDLLTSSPRQAWLARTLGGQAPEYAHVPLAVNAEGRRLAKRDGSVTLADLAARGHTPSQVLTLLASSLGLCAPDEPVSLEMLLERFDPARLPREPWVVPADILG